VHADILSFAELALWIGSCKEIEETNKEEKKSWWM
jgi:hypothetical protein